MPPIPVRLVKGLVIFEHVPVDLGGRCDLPGILGEETTNDLFRILLDDTIERFATLGMAHVMVFARDEKRKEELKLRYPLLDVHAQAGDTVCERLQFAFEDGFEAGFRHIMLLSSHIPTVPVRVLESGFTLLDAFDDALVMGASTRGGYYAVGMRRLHDELFEYMDYALPDLYEETLKRISATDTALFTLPVWHGLKTMVDLKRLYADVLDNSTLRHTAAFFQSHPIFSVEDI